MAIDLTERTPEQHVADIHRYNKTLRPNTASPCYIDAIFELLWNSVMPHFGELMLNKFDSILKISYKWHRLNTDDGRNRASYSMRKFIWENKISNRGEGFWEHCNEVLETSLNNLSPSARFFCDIRQFYTYKLCSRNQSHSGYISSNMPYLHYNHSLMQALLKSKESQCMYCTRELGKNSAEVPGITTRHNLIGTEKLPLFLFVSDLTNIAPGPEKSLQSSHVLSK